jgi:hypothetical protein
MSWNTIENILYCKWVSTKKAANHPMSFYPDAEDFALDFYFLFACYFIVGAGSRHTQNQQYRNAREDRGLKDSNFNHVFPWHANDSSVHKINSIVKECIGKVKDMPIGKNFMGTSLRSGSAQEVSYFLYYF